MEYITHNIEKPKENPVKIGFILAFILLFSVIFLSVGFFMSKSTSNKMQVYTESTVGVITYIDSYISESKDMDGHISHTRMYTNTYEYTVDGIDYTLTDSISTNHEGNIGDEMTIRYNPINPNEAISEKDIDGSSFMGLIFSIIGGVVFVVSLCIGRNLLWKKSREKYKSEEY